MARPRKLVLCPSPFHGRGDAREDVEVARDASGHLLVTCGASSCVSWAKRGAYFSGRAGVPK